MQTTKDYSSLFVFENEARKSGYSLVIGLDESGRGPLAGPVVAAAVAVRHPRFKVHINDSKKLSPRQREAAMEEITRKTIWGAGIMSPEVVDEVNISRATYHAMHNAVWQLFARLPRKTKYTPGFQKKVMMLVDGKYFRSDLPFAYQTIVKGDGRSLSIACASILAKVLRDRMLDIYHHVFPGYNFKRHKGYPTLAHCRALSLLGPCSIHRRTFKYKIDGNRS